MIDIITSSTINPLPNVFFLKILTTTVQDFIEINKTTARNWTQYQQCEFHYVRSSTTTTTSNTLRIQNNFLFLWCSQPFFAFIQIFQMFCNPPKCFLNVRIFLGVKKYLKYIKKFEYALKMFIKNHSLLMSLHQTMFLNRCEYWLHCKLFIQLYALKGFFKTQSLFL